MITQTLVLRILHIELPLPRSHDSQEVFAPIAGIGAWESALVARKKRLQEELERQRALAKERLLFSGKCIDFGATVERAQEYTRFPLATDTSEMLDDLLKEGTKQVSAQIRCVRDDAKACSKW